MLSLNQMEAAYLQNNVPLNQLEKEISLLHLDQIDVPRDRNSEFEPQLIRKGQTRFDGFLAIGGLSPG